MYFGLSKISGKYVFKFEDSDLINPVYIPREQHQNFIQHMGTKMISADENGNPILIDRPKKQYTDKERLQERITLHRDTDDDYAKYSRNIRLGIDVEYSQSVLNYIDQYNQQVSETVNQEGFPQEVTYPEYVLP